MPSNLKSPVTESCVVSFESLHAMSQCAVHKRLLCGAVFLQHHSSEAEARLQGGWDWAGTSHGPEDCCHVSPLHSLRCGPKEGAGSRAAGVAGGCEVSYVDECWEPTPVLYTEHALFTAGPTLNCFQCLEGNGLKCRMEEINKTLYQKSVFHFLVHLQKSQSFVPT